MSKRSSLISSVIYNNSTGNILFSALAHAQNLENLLGDIKKEIVDQRDVAKKQWGQLLSGNQKQIKWLSKARRIEGETNRAVQQILGVCEAARDTMLREREAHLVAARVLLRGDSSPNSIDDEGDGKYHAPSPPPHSEHE